VLALGGVVRATWWLWAGGALALAAAGWRMHRDGVPASLLVRLARLPLVGSLLRDAAAARAAHVLGTLLDAGVPLDASIPLAAEAAGPVLDPAVRRAGTHVRDGGTLAQGFGNAAVFPPLLARLVATGERTGTLGASLRHAAELLDAEVARRLERAAAAIEPAFVLGAGAAVLAIVLGVLLPILDFDPTGMR
jgi:type II secretory pathway component PulF